MRGKEIKKILLALVLAGIITQGKSVSVQALENNSELNTIEVVESTEINEEAITTDILTEEEEVVEDIEEEKPEIKKGWQFEGGNYYFCNEDGSLKKGFYKDQYGDTYYLNLTTGKMEIGWVHLNEKYYFFNSNGTMKKGWYSDGYDWYFLNNENGMMHTGWLYENNKYYFLNNDGTMKSGFYTDNNKDTYYLDINSGAMATGWKLNSNNDYHYYQDNGVMVNGWSKQDNIWYYLDKDNNGIMQKGLKEISGAKYNFENSGALIVDRWYEGTTTYSDLNGEYKVITSSTSATVAQYNMINYIKSVSNRDAIHNRSIELHNGVLINNCVYFTSELLRRAGINIPTATANTRQLETQLLNRGWKKYTNLNDLRPGDILYAGYAHAFTFVGWAGNGYAYIVDNQKGTFGTVLHKRKIASYDPVYDTNKATHFYRAI